MAPATGGGFFLTSVAHRVSGSKPCLGLAKAAHGTIPSALGHKKPGVTCTTGRVMGEIQIWRSIFALTSPTYSVIKVGTELQYTIEEISSPWHK